MSQHFSIVMGSPTFAWVTVGFPTTIGNVNETTDKIRSFHDLHDRWHFGDGIAPTPATLMQAITLNQLLRVAGFTQTNAFPLVSGGVRVTAYSGKYYLEFSLERSGLVDYILEENDQEVEYKESVSQLDTWKIIQDCGGKLWALSDLSTRFTSTTSGIKFKVAPSITQVMGVVSQSSRKNVPYEIIKPFAVTLPNTMKSNRPLSSGDYLKMLYHTTASSSRRLPTPMALAITT